MKYTTKDINKRTGLTYYKIRYIADLLNLNPDITSRQHHYTEDQVLQIENFGKQTIEKIIYKPIHTYFNVMIIPSKMNFLTLEQL